jgi:hypothetical protein
MDSVGSKSTRHLIDIPEPRYSPSMSGGDERDKRLDNFNKTFSKDLDDALARQKREIEQRLSQDFTFELNQAEECTKNGDFIGASMHKLRAEMINDLLKKWD